MLKTDIIICQSIESLKEFSNLLISTSLTSNQKTLPKFSIKDPNVDILKAFGIRPNTHKPNEDSDDSIEIIDDDKAT